MTVTNALTEPLLSFDDQDPVRLSTLPPLHPLVVAIANIAASAQNNSVLQQANATLQTAAQQASIAATLNAQSTAMLAAATGLSTPRATYQFTAAAAQTVWSAPAGVTFVPGTIDVFVNGIRWNRVESYDDSAGNKVTFANPLTLGYVVTVLIGTSVVFPVVGVSAWQLALATPGNGADMVGFVGANGVATTVSGLASSANGKGTNLIAHGGMTLAQAIGTTVADYPSLRAYTGPLKTILVTGYLVTVAPEGIAGMFVCDDTDTTSADNGGTVIVANGKRFKRVMDGKRFNVRWFGANGGGSGDDTIAFNNCFAAAQAAKAIAYAPGDAYVVGNLLFGAQNTTGQSVSPLGFIGDGWNTQIVAKQGLTGTLFQAWSIAGVILRDFTIFTAGTAAQAIDADWKAGAGPSTQNVIENICVNGGSAATHVSLRNLNDTVPKKLVVNGTSQSQCGIDMTASGGLNTIRDSIWNQCYLKFGSQNGTIDGCWGHGILAAQGCLNYLKLAGCYIYSNTHLDSCLASESFSSFQSIHSLESDGTQFITETDHVTSYFNINLYAKAAFRGCQFIGSTTRMFGPNSRGDSYSGAKVLFEGGSSQFVPESTGPFIVETDGFENDTTAKFHPEFRSSIYASGIVTATFNSATWYDVIPQGALTDGTYVVELFWTDNSTGQPYLWRAAALVSVLSIDSGAGNFSQAIPAPVNSYFVGDGQAVSLRLASTGNGPKIQFSWTAGANSGAALNGGTLSWKARKFF